ncbi:conserved hypothetical protein [Neospora caninum Liverpool]|uniref:Transmembrane protein n=1 Tax=Neospora caninum (strain Liverpool) TaxID=572307 RepID=F0VCC7_NEOCL|nr:conserved hypothetical protein [Neospora caninum Liverpool]CBZ51261.1 conserved hypothetical protein [Neospora caninum Liverpool]CEL68576.1 TPA: hypothetical protein BN1204_043290 [Neospora caninum Liverpool]|eukprot:XP_003881294.1 conserved hypothetical protein [Neospora caninum Liverpool]
MEARNSSRRATTQLCRVRCVALARTAVLVVLGVLFLSQSILFSVPQRSPWLPNVAIVCVEAGQVPAAPNRDAEGNQEVSLVADNSSAIKDGERSENKESQQQVKAAPGGDSKQNASGKEKPAPKAVGRKVRAEQQAKLLATMKELLQDNRDYRKMQADREREKLLKQYTSEDDDLDPEESPIFVKELERFKKLQTKKSVAGAASIVSMALASAGMLVYWMANKKGEFLEREDRKSHQRSNAGLIASSVAGAIGLGLSQWQRRRYKKQINKLQQRLVRMEKEAYAGHAPEDEPFLGVDEEAPEDKRKREKAERLREQQQQRH